MGGGAGAVGVHHGVSGGAVRSGLGGESRGDGGMQRGGAGRVCAEARIGMGGLWQSRTTGGQRIDGQALTNGEEEEEEEQEEGESRIWCERERDSADEKGGEEGEGDEDGGSGWEDGWKGGDSSARGRHRDWVGSSVARSDRASEAVEEGRPAVRTGWVKAEWYGKEEEEEEEKETDDDATAVAGAAEAVAAADDGGRVMAESKGAAGPVQWWGGEGGSAAISRRRVKMEKGSRRAAMGTMGTMRTMGGMGSAGIGVEGGSSGSEGTLPGFGRPWLNGGARDRAGD
nr:hypothetical protein CFP56_58239 [Quercus suber]